MVSNRSASAVLEPETTIDQPTSFTTTKAAAKSRFSPANISSATKLKLKIGISLVMFASLFIFGKIDLSKSWEIALKANKWYLGAAVSIYLLTTFLNAYRWKILARAVGLDRPLLKLVQYCYVGLYFNLFLPSTVGGDFSRCYYLSKGTGLYKQAFYSVMADRVVGISVLFLFACLGILLGPGGGGMPWQLKAPIFLGTFAIFTLIPLAPKMSRLLLGPDNWLTKKFNNSASQIYWQDKKLIAYSMLLSVVMQVVVVVVHVLVGMALGLTNIPLWYYFVFYPSVAVLGFVTPSFNGIGIREWAYTYFLTMMGVDNSHALTYAIMWLSLITFSSLFGGLVYVAGHFTMPKQQESEKLQFSAD